MSVRVRLAPSPTGPLHVGTARTALFNFLFAKGHDGTFLLRIEDTDRERSKPEYETEIIEGLRWLGLSWDEGPDVGGPHAPYRQSERTPSYRAALEQLLREGKAYEQEGAILLRVVSEDIVVEDLIRGSVRFPASEQQDFAIARAIDDPLFHLAVVLDDAEMRITHVIRGEDHLSNTPRHLLLQRALGLPKPQYAHVPLLLDTQRKKLSKRTADTGLLAYRDKGYLPEAMVNFLVLLGWNPKTTEEVFTMEDLAERFDLAGVQKGDAVFDLQKLDWLQRQHLRKLSPSALADRARTFLKKTGCSVPDRAVLERAVTVWRERGGTLSDFPRDMHFVLEEPELNDQDFPWRGTTVAQGLESSTYCSSVLEQLTSEWNEPQRLREALLGALKREGKDLGTYLWPTRYALTGERESPDWSEVAWILGLTETLRRLRDVQKLVLKKGKQ